MKALLEKSCLFLAYPNRFVAYPRLIREPNYFNVFEVIHAELSSKSDYT